MISAEQSHLNVKTANAKHGVAGSHGRYRRLTLLNALAVTTSLVGCGQAPDDIASMRLVIDEQILLETSDIDATETTPLQLGQFEAALLAAVSQNDLYRAALAAETAAKAQVNTALSSKRPQISSSLNAGLIQDTSNDDDVEKGAIAGINLSQLIYDGGESTAEINRANAQVLIAEADRMVRGNDVASQAARAWVDVWQQQSRAELLGSRISKLNELISQVERMAANGMVDRSVVDSATRERLEFEMVNLNIQADLQDAELRFQSLFNTSPVRLSLPANVITAPAIRAEASAPLQAPELQKSVAELIVARSAVSSAEAGFEPRVRLQAGVRSPVDQQDDVNGSLGMVVEYVIGDGGRRQSQFDSATAQLQRAEAQVAAAKQALETDLDISITRLDAIERSLQIVTQREELAFARIDTLQSQLATGQTGLSQLIDAEVQLFRVRDQSIAMRAEREILVLTIGARLGLLAREIGLRDADS
ncbi:TolC family protein [Yoonia vestfoldensis]|uniref:Outer membrane efflux protein BepC n=1 Tax=Yoonia vestfoldensis TaxID=245188 RepID=A0A1Y0EDP5_9RHOB|nr:TolC family protein [Yoonia vestfoldensis]ARU01724.1 outer membrane efflux protein BepC [Yoonia vestfoldensis]